MKGFTYKHTIAACLIGYISQAIIVNLAPLLFLTFAKEFNLRLFEITLLTTLNFLVQLCTDLLASKYAEKIGYRKCLVAAHLLCVVGLIGMAFLPSILPPLVGLLVSVCLYAIGGGLLEVLVSPTIEACPTKNKTGMMSILHSFYCWGVVATVLLSTLFFMTCGVENWRALVCLWAIVPLINALFFTQVPIFEMQTNHEGADGYKTLFKQKLFWVLVLLMICAGSCELAVAQWASALTEQGLGVSKTMGDLLGVCGFAVMMGISRSIYGKFSEKLPLKQTMAVCAVLCAVGYLLIAFSPVAIVGFIGCMLSGFSVGIFWPGTFSLATRSMKNGGTTMFALLALSGDVGCCLGPTLVGFTSGGGLQTGILFALVFPALLLFALALLKNEKVE
jgi:MFS family permease